jgi:hypothetical protein
MRPVSDICRGCRLPSSHLHYCNTTNIGWQQEISKKGREYRKRKKNALLEKLKNQVGGIFQCPACCSPRSPLPTSEFAVAVDCLVTMTEGSVNKVKISFYVEIL